MSIERNEYAVQVPDIGFVRPSQSGDSLRPSVKPEPHIIDTLDNAWQLLRGAQYAYESLGCVGIATTLKVVHRVRTTTIEYGDWSEAGHA